MTSSILIRWGAIGAILAGIAWTVLGLISLLIHTYAVGEAPLSLLSGLSAMRSGGQSLFLAAAALYGIASIGTLGGLVGLHAQQAAGYGRLGRAGFVAAFIGATMRLAGLPIGPHSFLARVGGWNLVVPALLLSVLGVLIGFVLLGVATLRAGVLPRWCGVALMFVSPALLLSAIPNNNEAIPGIVVGLVWLGLGYALWSLRNVPTGQPPRHLAVDPRWQATRRQIMWIGVIFSALTVGYLGALAATLLGESGSIEPERVGSIVLWSLGVVVVLTVVVFLIRLGYRYEWTGFSEAAHSKEDVQQTQRAKTLWDWLALLIIPAVLAVGGLLFSLAQDARQRETDTQRTQDAALQAYLDEMGSLLLDKKLLPEEPDDEARTLARAQTLPVLDRLDPTRKRSVLQFLYESNLIGKEKPVIKLEGANLREAALPDMNLTKASLREVQMQRTNLSRASLNGADLSGTRLIGATLNHAGLNGADLSGAVLQGANLADADLRGASLKDTQLYETRLIGADLRGTDLRDVRVAPSQQSLFAQALGDQTTQLPNGFQRPEAWSQSIDEQREQLLNQGHLETKAPPK